MSHFIHTTKPHLRRRQWNEIAEATSSSSTVWWTPQPGDAAYVSTTAAPVDEQSLSSSQSSNTKSKRKSKSHSSTVQEDSPRPSSEDSQSTSDESSSSADDNADVFTPSQKIDAVAPASSTAVATRTSKITQTSIVTSLALETSTATSIRFLTVTQSQSTPTPLPVASTSSTSLSSSSEAVFSMPSNAAVNVVSPSQASALPSSTSSSAPIAIAEANNKGFFETLKHSPGYLTLASLLGLLVLALLAAGLGFAIRRWCHKRKRRLAFAEDEDWFRNASNGVVYAASNKSGWTKADDQSSTRSNRLSTVAEPVQEQGQAAPVAPELDRQNTQTSTRWSWLMGRSHSQQSEPDHFTAMPPRTSQTVARLSHVGQGLHPPNLLPSHLPYANPQSNGNAPTLAPWTSLVIDSPEMVQQPPAANVAMASRFSAFSSPPAQNPFVGSNRDSLPLPLLAPVPGPVSEATKRNSADSQELSRTGSNASSVWSTSTGATEDTEKASGSRRSLSATAATSMARGSSDASDASFQSDRVSIFRQKLSNGLINPSRANSIRTSLSMHKTRTSWELLDDDESRASKQAGLLVRARAGRASLEAVGHVV